MTKAAFIEAKTYEEFCYLMNLKLEFIAFTKGNVRNLSVSNNADKYFCVILYDDNTALEEKR